MDNKDEGIWINGKHYKWEDPTKETLHECAYIVEKRLGGNNLCNIVDELLAQGIHPRDIAWGLIETQFALKEGTRLPPANWLKREALRLSRLRPPGNQ